MKFTYASSITLIRILMTPLIVYTIMNQFWGYTLLLFMGAMFTDFLDGFIARLYNQTSLVGALLDPIADKCLIVGSLYGLLFTTISDTFVQQGIYFLLIKELILVTGAAILFIKYRYFIKPSLFSRVVSVSEMLYALCVVVVAYAQWSVPLQWLHIFLGMICVGACGLLVLYAVYIIKLMREKL